VPVALSSIWAMGLKETVVGLLRNGGCVAKSLLHSSHYLMLPFVGQVTSLESFIALLQFAAVYFNLRDALPVLLRAVAATLNPSVPSERVWLQSIALTGSKPGTVCFAEQSVTSTAAGTRQSVAVASCKLIIAVAFVFLGLGSIHVPYPICTQWAVVSLELALLFLLTVMAAGVRAEARLASDKARLSRALKVGELLALDTPEAMSLAVGATIAATPNSSVEMPTPPWDKAPPAADPLGTMTAKVYMQALDGAHESIKQLITANRATIAVELNAEAVVHRYQTALDAVLLLCNVLAFVGYAVFPLTFFAPEKAIAAVVPLWPGNSSAQYAGNLLGDAAWTVEPFLALFAPPTIIQPAGTSARAAGQARTKTDPQAKKKD